MIKQKVCPKCDYDVYLVADLSWDAEKQDWKIVWTNDEVHCARCGHDFKLKDCKVIE
jgi:hypothetical protein